MSYQAYLDTVKAKTGKSPDDFRKLAEKRGFLREGVKAAEVLSWLKSDYGLGHGHAMAIYGAIRQAVEPAVSPSQRIASHFAGDRAAWKLTYERLLATARDFGPDVSVKGGDSYISVLKAGKKFAIFKIGTAFVDVGLKLKGVENRGRLQPSGRWNAMVTHRVRLQSARDLDAEVLAWMRQAYSSV